MEQKLKALIVDDSESTLTLVSKLLAGLDVDSDTALNGKEGLDKFTEAPDSYNILFIDINMPELGGLDLTKEIRSRGSKVPIIAFTATATVECGAKSKAAGVDKYLSKLTINKKLLAAILEAYCGREQKETDLK